MASISDQSTIVILKHKDLLNVDTKDIENEIKAYGIIANLTLQVIGSNDDQFKREEEYVLIIEGGLHEQS